MTRIEHAIFTSARTERGLGYHVVASSPGIHTVDQRALSIWGPSHDSLLNTGGDAVSINFFPLPSGAFCISRTTPVGWEYSGRGGARIHTHCLVASGELFWQIANHPLAVAWAAAAGVFDQPAEIPATLAPLELPETLPLASPASQAQTLMPPLTQAEAEQVALLQQSVLTCPHTVAVASRMSMERLIAGLFDGLPLHNRTAISFTTGLRYSARRPFRIIPLPADPPARRWLARQHQVLVVDLEKA